NGSDPPFAKCPLRELEITGRQQPAEVEQLEVRALGWRQHETRAGKRATQTIALRLEEGRQLPARLRPFGQIGGHRVLQRGRDTERVELVDFAQLARE